MIGVSTLCLVAYTIASAIVGVRLLLRAQRSHGVPELLAGLSYVGAPALGYPMVIVASTMANRALAIPIYVVGETLLVSGCCCFLFFTMKVFRPGAGWAMWTAAVGAAVLAWAGFEITRAFLSSTDPLEIAAHARAGLTAMVTVLALSYVWTALEGLRYYRMMRKRMALGLADPVVTNRFFLWTCSGLTSVAWISFTAVMLAAGANLATNPLNVSVTCAGGIANTVFLLLIFMPPAAYTRWITRSARAPELATV
jgi:hypothetical protein